MYNFAPVILTALIFLGLFLGCQSHQPQVMTEDTKPADTEAEEAEPETFIFAESHFLNIDSDMLAQQLENDRIPRIPQTVDSAAAVNAVYNMLLDSLLGLEVADFQLAVEDSNLYDQYIMLRNERILKLLYINEIQGKVEVSDSAVERAYIDNKDFFMLPGEYRARHLVIAGHVLKDEDSATYKSFSEGQMDSIAYDMVADIRRRLLDGASFDTLAMMYSHDPNTKEKGGDLGYFQLEAMVSPFDSAVEHTPVGEISGPVKTIYGWHVLKVEDISPPHARPLDSVSAGIRQQLKARATSFLGQAFIDSVVANGTFLLDTAALSRVDSELISTDPLAYVNLDDKEYGNDTVYAGLYFRHAYNFKLTNEITGEMSLEQKAELLKSLAIRYHLSRAARKLGYGSSEEMIHWSDSLYQKYSISILRRRLLEDDYKPTEEEIKQYYDANLSDYVSDRPVYVQHIIFSDSSLAEHVRDILHSGVDFMEMAEKYYPGDPEIRQAAADLGYIGQRDMPREFYDVAMRTTVGTISHPVKTEFGYHLIKVVDKQMPADVSKAGIKIRQILVKRHKEQKVKDFVESHLGKPPKIHWESIGDLYRKKIPGPVSRGQTDG